MPRSPLALVSMFKAILLSIVGVVSAGASWLACDRFAVAATKADVDVKALGQPAHAMLTTPPLAAIPGLTIVALALLALFLPRARLPLLLLATVVLIVAIGLMVLTAVQFIGPMYEYKPL